MNGDYHQANSKKITLTKINAYDETGKLFDKTVTLSLIDVAIPVLSFGWPYNYYINDLFMDYPYSTPLCIDAYGLNHNGSPVCIGPDTLNDVIRMIPLAIAMNTKVKI